MGAGDSGEYLVLSCTGALDTVKIGGDKVSGRLYFWCSFTVLGTLLALVSKIVVLGDVLCVCVAVLEYLFTLCVLRSWRTLC